MKFKWLMIAAAALGLASMQAASAQDAKTVLADAQKAMGQLKTVEISGSGADFVLGQAFSPSEARRKLFAHINVTIGLVGFIGGAVEAIRGYLSAKAKGLVPDQIALASKLTMTGLLLVYVILCVRSFIVARAARKA